MKRYSLFLGLVGLFTMAQAQQHTIPPYMHWHCTDGSTQVYRGTDIKDILVQDRGRTLCLSMADMSTVNYAANFVREVTFSSAYDGNLDSEQTYEVAIDPQDDTQFTSVPEQVVTDKMDPAYGDFIENFHPTAEVVITWKGSTATYTGAPAGVSVLVKGADVVISSVRTKDVAYTLRGNTSSGSFKLYSDYKCQLNLDGVSITNPAGAAINIQCKKTILVNLPQGKTNKLTDGPVYTLMPNEDQKGCFFSEGQLVFSGKGSLSVKSVAGHGIVSDDYLRVRDGVLNVEAARDACKTNDCFLMYGGTVLLKAGDDGLDVGKGYIDIAGGRLTVDAYDMGMATTYAGDAAGVIDPLITPYIKVRGGLVKVSTGKEKGHAVRSNSTLDVTGGILQLSVKGDGSKCLMSDGAMSLLGGKVTAFTSGASAMDSLTHELSSSACIRSKGMLMIENMTLALKSTGNGAKAINNMGNIAISNSQITAVTTGKAYSVQQFNSRPRGISADGAIQINGGKLRIAAVDDALYTGMTLRATNAVIFARSTAGKKVNAIGGYGNNGGCVAW